MDSKDDKEKPERLEGYNFDEVRKSPRYGESLRWSKEQKEKSINDTVKSIVKNINESAKNEDEKDPDDK